MNSRDEALRLYRKLLLARLSEEKIRELYPSNEIKSPVHLGIGGEAIPVGVCHCLPENSKYFGTYRNHTLYLTLTGDTDGFFAELYGRASGAGGGKAGSMHLMAPDRGLMATSAVVATTIPVAVGAAMAARYRGSDDWVAVFFGDGAMEEGVFWESLNFACLHKLRILFVCEDNGLAIHSHDTTRRGFRSIPESVGGFRCHVLSGDGSRLSTVVEKTREAVTRMKKDSQPAFLHLTYFRFLEHVGPKEDFAAGYRPAPTEAERGGRDPVAIFEGELKSLKCSRPEMDAIRSELAKQVDASSRKAQAAPSPSPPDLLTDVFS